jgi:hypothetical protein
VPLQLLFAPNLVVNYQKNFLFRKPTGGSHGSFADVALAVQMYFPPFEVTNRDLKCATDNRENVKRLNSRAWEFRPHGRVTD